MKRYALYILDLDGTLYRGDEAIPNAADTVARLRSEGSLIRFLTNNSGQTRLFYRAKLSRLGFPCEESEIYSSAIGAARYCQEEGLGDVFFVGEPGLRETLEEGRINVVNGVRSSQAVVAGICRSFTYEWMDDALQEILSGAKFVATNTDATYPLEGGRVEPGAGAVVASICASSGVEPFVIGKPNPYLLDVILEDSGVAKEDAIAVGDRYETDILSGRNAGIATHLVLTGVTQSAPSGVGWSDDLCGLL